MGAPAGKMRWEDVLMGNVDMTCMNEYVTCDGRRLRIVTYYICIYGKCGDLFCPDHHCMRTTLPYFEMQISKESSGLSEVVRDIKYLVADT